MKRFAQGMTKKPLMVHIHILKHAKLTADDAEKADQWWHSKHPEWNAEEAHAEATRKLEAHNYGVPVRTAAAQSDENPVIAPDSKTDDGEDRWVSTFTSLVEEKNVLPVDTIREIAHHEFRRCVQAGYTEINMLTECVMAHPDKEMFYLSRYHKVVHPDGSPNY